MSDLVLRDARLIYPDGTEIHGGLVVRDGRIVDVFEGTGPATPAGAEEVDAGGRPVIPGVIDPHVQLYPQPDWAHYATETRSAALGGVTTIVKMHRDLEGYDRDAFWAEVAGAESRAHVDFAFHLAVMSDAQIDAIPRYARELELTSFKTFTAYKGEEGYRIAIQGVDDAQLASAFEHVAELGGVMLVHCENQELANRALARVRAEGRDGLRAFADSRPWLVEAEAIGRAATLADAAGATLYVVHVTSRQGLAELVRRRAAGQRVIVETEAHYLTDTCDSPAGNLLKVIPPLREEADRLALWDGVVSGHVDTIGSDHVAATRERKQGSIWDAQLGFAGIATILPALLDEGVNRGRLSLARLVAVTSANAARLLGLAGKGALLPGFDADLVVLDLDRERVVDAAGLGSTSDFSVYEGRTMRGWPALTVSRGVVVMRDGRVVGPEGHGRYLRRRPTG
ncbi:MAG: amidohydrolase family protein [Thermoleophilia bacterium]